jgi:hypothetical protein
MEISQIEEQIKNRYIFHDRFLKLLFSSFFFCSFIGLKGPNLCCVSVNLSANGPKDDLPLFLKCLANPYSNLLMAGAGYSHKPQDPKPLHLLIADFHM